MEYEVLDQDLLALPHKNKKCVIAWIRDLNAQIGDRLIDENGTVFLIESIAMIRRIPPMDLRTAPFVLEGPALPIGKRVRVEKGAELLETERLELVPLTLRHLHLWVEDLPALEQALRCDYRGEPVEGVFREIVKGQLAATARDPARYMWHSFWFLIRKEDRCVVGSADFKDVPNSRGEVEIGYGLGKAFKHNGYMTEAVAALCEWAFRQAEVRGVIAETDLDGTASQRVLQRCGFVESGRGETVWWRKQKPS